MTPITNWLAFRQEFQSAAHVQLPQLPRCEAMRILIDVRNYRCVTPGFIRFDANWRGEFLPLPRSLQFGFHDLLKPMRAALRPVFMAHAVHWAPGGRFSDRET